MMIRDLHLGITAAVVLAWAGLCTADYGQEVRKDSPLVHLPCADRQVRNGAPAKDLSGGHDSIYRGPCTTADGPAELGGRAVRLDGRSAWVELPHSRELELSELSVEIWFCSSQTWNQPVWPFSATLVSKATEAANSSDWTINGGCQAGGRVVALVGATGRASDFRLESRRRPLNDGRWHHVVWTRSAGGENSLYVDGRRHGRGQDGGGRVVNDRPIQIGGDPFLKGTYLDGMVAQVAVYSRVLPAERVKAHFLAGGGREAEPPAPAARVLERMVLSSPSGLTWEPARTASGWALGGVRLAGRPADEPVLGGVLALRHEKSGELTPLPAQTCRRTGERSAVLAGTHKVGQATLTFAVELALREDMPQAGLDVRWSLDRDLEGYELCAAWQEPSSTEWRCTMYPFAGDSGSVLRRRLSYLGVPAALMFKDDLSLVTLFGIDPSCDYFNPHTWTGSIGFAFEDQEQAPQFRVGPAALRGGQEYRLPLQVFFSVAGESASAITQLVRNWIAANNYRVQPLHVRTPQEGFDLFLDGRRNSRMWRPGMGYQINDGWKVVYTAESPINAWFDYLVYEQTGERMWRQRAFETADWMLKAQHTEPGDPHFGAIDTNYELDTGRFTSRDHSPNWRYKLDMNAYAAHYLLLLWERVKQKEGLDRQEWRQAAVRMADWICRQQNSDGGLPQVVHDDPARRSISVVSGRALVAMPVIARITGQDKYARLAGDLERFLRTRCEGRFWFTGAHVDLWPKDYESDSVWHAVEYWLDAYDRTRRRECLDRALADAYLAFLMWCPRQLSWVAAPTQTCHAEQENYLQYSNYCYNNRKVQCLDRLHRLAGDKLMAQLRDRIIQCMMYGQVTAGPWKGGQYERLSDPWGSVSKDVNSRGVIYASELALDANLQWLEMGLARARPPASQPSRPDKR